MERMFWYVLYYIGRYRLGVEGATEYAYVARETLPVMRGGATDYA
jgi:hypothetical protein